MIKMKYLILVMVFLVGCAEVVSEQEINNAIEACKNNGGLVGIYDSQIDTPNVKCKNGAYFTQKEIKL